VTHDTGPTTIPLDTLRLSLERQVRAALAMLRDAVERCPGSLWDDPGPTNAFWQIAYHTLYFTHLYLQPEEAAFRPWPGHQADVQHPDGIAGPADPASPLPLVPEPYTRGQVLAYAAHLDERLHDALQAIDLLAPDSGPAREPAPPAAPRCAARGPGAEPRGRRRRLGELAGGGRRELTGRGTLAGNPYPLARGMMGPRVIATSPGRPPIGGEACTSSCPSSRCPRPAT